MLKTTPNIISGFRFEGNTTDWVNGNTQTNNGATLTTGKFGQCYSFNGTTNYMGMTLPANLKTSNFTFSGWINLNNNTTQQFFTSLMPRGAASVGLGWNIGIVTSGKVQVLLGSNAGTWTGLTGNTVLSTATWYHIAATYDGTNAKIYINGVQDAASSPAITLVWTDLAAGNYPDPAQFFIGAYKTNALGGGATVPDYGFTNGLLDEMMFFDKALTEGEIRSLMLGFLPTEN